MIKIMDEVFNKKIELDTFILIGEINDFNLIDELIKDVKEGVKTSSVSRKTNVTGEHTHLILNVKFHEFLKKIQPSIYKVYQENFTVKEVWGNIFSCENDFAFTHSHANSAFCGILYCTEGPGPGTYFNQYDLTVEEKKGRFVLFHPRLLHEVKPYQYKKERITIAWNFGATRPWDDLSQAYFIRNNLNL